MCAVCTRSTIRLVQPVQSAIPKVRFMYKNGEKVKPHPPSVEADTPDYLASVRHFPST